MQRRPLHQRHANADATKGLCHLQTKLLSRQLRSTPGTSTDVGAPCLQNAIAPAVDARLLSGRGSAQRQKATEPSRRLQVSLRRKHAGNFTAGNATCATLNRDTAKLR